MQFKHPDLLYALLLLIIPIIIHLFQLRKFQKEAFTNVAFLKTFRITNTQKLAFKKVVDPAYQAFIISLYHHGFCSALF